MPYEVEYRIAKELDAEELTVFINNQYARKKNPAYFLWQYFSSCYPTVLMCAFQNHALIGMFGLQRKKLTNGAVVGQAIDLLVVPEWRGKGIFGELGRRAMSCFPDLDAVCVLPNAHGKVAAEKSLGWKTIGKINSMCRNISGGIKPPGRDYDEYSATAVHQQFMRFAYDSSVREWRFKKNPIYRYDYVALDADTFAVTKVFQDPVTNVRYGDIVDFECPLGEKKRFASLFERASRHLERKRVETITTWALPSSPIFPVVKGLGFQEISQERYFCLGVLNGEYEYLYNFSHWHLVEADAEVY